MPGLFLSYAHADGEDRAAELRQRLTREAPDVIIEQDRLFLEGGAGWWKQITDAIDSVEFLILVMTPAALVSGNVEKEWRYARQQGVCVYPVKGAPDAKLHFEKMPRWMSKAHFYDLDKEWLTFLAHLRKGCDRRRVPFMAPDLPAHFVERPREYEALKKLLFTAERGQPVAITTAVAGAGGFGKTTLAAALCHDEDIIEYFDDGILWVTLGQTPDVVRSLLKAYAALTDERPAFSDIEDAAIQLGQKLEQRTCLVVIDDVWDAEHLRPFLRGGKSSARLFTTRNAAIASEEATPVNVDQMREDEAVSLLTKGVIGLGGEQARELSGRLGEWPLALEIAAAMMRERIQQGESASRAAERLVTIIERKGLQALEDPTAERRHRTISSVVEASIDLGAPDGKRLAELSIFPEDAPIPLAAAASVWELEELDAEDVARRLGRLSLLKVDLGRNVLSLHDVMRNWLASTFGGARESHERLLNAWPDWRRLPELPGEYGWRWLCWHLTQAGRKDDIDRILWDPQWMQAKLKATDVNALTADYEHLKPSFEADLVQGALGLSANTLAADVEQFASQMAGRLLPHQDSPRIRRFTEEIAANATGPWLRLLHPALLPPGTGLVRTVEGHRGAVNGVAVTPDGKRAVSASSDRTLKVWDLESGRAVRTLEGHSFYVNGVALMPDGKRAVSASWDHTLKVWDLESGRAVRTLEGHFHVNGVAVTPDGMHAVSASGDDHTLTVWDLETGHAVRALEGHSADVSSVAVMPDGKRAVSASSDKTLKLWDLESGRAVRTLVGHSGSVNCVAVMPDGQRAVSASSDYTLKVWDLESGRALHTLAGHFSDVNAVAVTPDGTRVVSGSRDHTLKVWDIAGSGESSRAVRTLAGHFSGVNGVAVTPDGKRAVSVSLDRTMKVWDIAGSWESARAVYMMPGHFSDVSGVAVTPDGKRAVSASWDKTLKVWDVGSGHTVRTLEDSASVYGVAVTPGGKRAISVSYENKMKVWDLESGDAVRTIKGGSSFSGVAVLPDGKRAVSSSRDYRLQVWDLESGRAVRETKDYSNAINAVAVAPDGRRAVSASRDHTLTVWDLESGHAVRSLKGHSASVYGVVVTSDGKLAVSASWDKTLKVWDLESGSAVRTLEGHSAPVNGVAVMPDGKRVVSASDDQTLRVWDLRTGMMIVAFHCDAPARCCACVDERRIFGGDTGGRVYFLSLVEAAEPPAAEKDNI